MSTAVLKRTNTFQHHLDLYFSMDSAFIHNYIKNRIQLYPHGPVDNFKSYNPTFFNTIAMFFHLSRGSYPQIFLMFFLLFLSLVRTIYYLYIFRLFQAQYLIDTLPYGNPHLFLIFTGF